MTFSKGPRGRILILAVIMVTVVLCAIVVALHSAYEAAFEEEKARLVETVQSQAALMEAVAEYDYKHSIAHHGPEKARSKAFDATLSQIRQAHTRFEGFGETGEFVLARRESDRIIFVLNHRHERIEKPPPIPWQSDKAQPTRRALLGGSGTMVGLDYRGTPVLAAYDVVPSLNIGIVAKIDLAEIRAPFIRAGLLAGGITCVLILLSAFLFVRIGGGMAYQLAETRQRLQSLFEQSQHAVLFVDAESGRIVDFNRATCELLECRDEDLTKADISSLTPLSVADEPHFEMMQRQETHVFETVISTRSDKPRHLWIESRALRVRNADLIAVLMSDVTDIRQAQASLRESEERYRSLVESSNLGIALIGSDKKIVSVNRRMKQMFPSVDIGSDSVCGSVVDRMTTADRERYCPVHKTFADGRVHEQIAEILVNEQPRTFRLVTSPVKGKSREVTSVIETIEDITDRITTERELYKQEKLESIGVLAGGIAHDFNNFLLAIIGNLSLARMELSPDSPLNEFLGEVEKASERARDLTQQLLTFARGGAPVKKAASLNELIRDSATFTLRGSSIECEFDLTDGLSAMVDEGQISQVIGNLVINAKHAMPEGGRLTITGHSVYVDEQDPVPLPEGEYVRITVSDEGVGIPEDKLSQIFDPFFTTKKDGNGLGLASCFAIVRKHNGHIQVQSQVGVGTSFTVFLPATEAAAGSEKIDEEEAVGGGGRILVMDDDVAVRKLTTKILHKHGFEVEAVSNGDDAVARVRDARRDGNLFQAAILDLTIPGGMGGRAAVAPIRNADVDITLIVSSGYSNDEVMAEHDRYGFDGRIVKPYRARELLATLQQVLRRPAPRGQAAATDV